MPTPTPESPMQDLNDFAHDVRRHPRAARALERLERDFDVARTALLAAMWLGRYGPPPDVRLAQQLARIASSPDDGSGHEHRRLAELEKVIRATLLSSSSAPVSVPEPDCESRLRGWLLLAAPASAGCTEQAWLIETLVDAMSRPELPGG